jgi:hypothetical protein
LKRRVKLLPFVRPLAELQSDWLRRKIIAERELKKHTTALPSKDLIKGVKEYGRRITEMLAKSRTRQISTSQLMSVKIMGSF